MVIFNACQPVGSVIKLKLLWQSAEDELRKEVAARQSGVTVWLVSPSSYYSY